MRDYLGSGEEMIPGIPAVSMRELGADPADAALMQRLRDESPNANAALLRRPVLIVAGGRDDRVPIRGVTHYAATLPHPRQGRQRLHRPGRRPRSRRRAFPRGLVLPDGDPAASPPRRPGARAAVRCAAPASATAPAALRGLDFQQSGTD